MRPITAAEAVHLFHWQWNDMQKALGDNADPEDREPYKEKWCREHGFQDVKHDCFLCEYSHKMGPVFCAHCPIKWPTRDGDCIDDISEDGVYLRGDYYLTAPISEILELPVKEDV